MGAVDSQFSVHPILTLQRTSRGPCDFCRQLPKSSGERNLQKVKMLKGTTSCKMVYVLLVHDRSSSGIFGNHLSNLR